MSALVLALSMHASSAPLRDGLGSASMEAAASAAPLWPSSRTAASAAAASQEREREREIPSFSFGLPQSLSPQLDDPICVGLFRMRKCVCATLKRDDS